MGFFLFFLSAGAESAGGLAVGDLLGSGVSSAGAESVQLPVGTAGMGFYQD